MGKGLLTSMSRGATHCMSLQLTAQDTNATEPILGVPIETHFDMKFRLLDGALKSLERESPDDLEKARGTSNVMY